MPYVLILTKDHSKGCYDNDHKRETDNSPRLCSGRSRVRFKAQPQNKIPSKSEVDAYFFLLLQVLSSTRSDLKPNILSVTMNTVEGAPPGSIIGSVRSQNHQQSSSIEGQVTYLVVGGSDLNGTFMVDRLKGDVYLVRELDYEKGSRYTLHIEVSDFSRDFPSSHLVQLDINVQDRNDHAPHFTEDPVTIVIPENMEPGASVYAFQALDKVKLHLMSRNSLHFYTFSFNASISFL